MMIVLICRHPWRVCRCDGETLSHQSVLLTEALEALAIKPEGVYLDGTFGRGGHAAEILKRLNDQGRLLAMDQDPQAVETAKQRFADDPRFEIVHANFESLTEVVCARGLDKKIDGILLDLGVSSPQLDDGSRGFSFMKAGPLDMRMNPQVGQSAAQWLAVVEEAELVDVLRRLGEERFAKRIARAIIETRQHENIDDTLQLAQIISDAIPRKENTNTLQPEVFRRFVFTLTVSLKCWKKCWLMQSMCLHLMVGWW